MWHLQLIVNLHEGGFSVAKSSLCSREAQHPDVFDLHVQIPATNPNVLKFSVNRSKCICWLDLAPGIQPWPLFIQWSKRTHWRRKVRTYRTGHMGAHTVGERPQLSGCCTGLCRHGQETAPVSDVRSTDTPATPFIWGTKELGPGRSVV